MEEKDNKSRSGSGLAALAVHLVCCGLPILIIAAGTTSIGTFFAGVAKNWLWVAILLIITIGIGTVFWVGFKKGKR
jgi:hypothetical protein